MGLFSHFMNPPGEEKTAKEKAKLKPGETRDEIREDAAEVGSEVESKLKKPSPATAKTETREGAAKVGGEVESQLASEQKVEKKASTELSEAESTINKLKDKEKLSDTEREELADAYSLFADNTEGFEKFKYLLLAIATRLGGFNLDFFKQKDEEEVEDAESDEEVEEKEKPSTQETVRAKELIGQIGEIAKNYNIPPASLAATALYRQDIMSVSLSEVELKEQAIRLKNLQDKEKIAGNQPIQLLDALIREEKGEEELIDIMAQHQRIMQSYKSIIPVSMMKDWNFGINVWKHGLSGKLAKEAQEKISTPTHISSSVSTLAPSVRQEMGEDLGDWLEESAKERGVDPNMVAAIMQIESQFNWGALNLGNEEKAGATYAQGSMQMMPQYVKAFMNRDFKKDLDNAAQQNPKIAEALGKGFMYVRQTAEEFQKLQKDNPKLASTYTLIRKYTEKSKVNGQEKKIEYVTLKIPNSATEYDPFNPYVGITMGVAFVERHIKALKKEFPRRMNGQKFEDLSASEQIYFVYLRHNQGGGGMWKAIDDPTIKNNGVEIGTIGRHVTGYYEQYSEEAIAIGTLDQLPYDFVTKEYKDPATGYNIMIVSRKDGSDKDGPINLFFAGDTEKNNLQALKKPGTYNAIARTSGPFVIVEGDPSNNSTRYNAFEEKGTYKKMVEGIASQIDGRTNIGKISAVAFSRGGEAVRRILNHNSKAFESITMCDATYGQNEQLVSASKEGTKITVIYKGGTATEEGAKNLAQKTNALEAVKDSLWVRNNIQIINAGGISHAETYSHYVANAISEESFNESPELYGPLSQKLLASSAEFLKTDFAKENSRKGQCKVISDAYMTFVYKNLTGKNRLKRPQENFCYTSPIATKATTALRGKYMRDLTEDDVLQYMQPGQAVFVNRTDKYPKGAIQPRTSHKITKDVEDKRHWFIYLGVDNEGKPRFLDNYTGPNNQDSFSLDRIKRICQESDRRIINIHDPLYDLRNKMAIESGDLKVS